MLLSSPRGDRDRDQFLLAGAVLGFALWLLSIGPARMWRSAAGPLGSWVLGVAPSFLAAWTFAFWQALAVRSKPFKAAAYAATLVATVEVVQLVLPRYLERMLHRYTADVWDVAAGVVGAAAALLVLLWREGQRRSSLQNGAA